MKNIHWDGVYIRTNDTSVGVTEEQQNASRRVFERSKVLSAKSNPNTNEGIVHKVWGMKVRSTLSGLTAATTLGMQMVAQIIRTDNNFPGAGEQLPPIVGGIDDTQTLKPNPLQNVAWEHVFRQAGAVNLGGAAFGNIPVQSSGFLEHEFYFYNPLIFVRPYFLANQCFFIASATASVRHHLELYLEVESCRVKGEQYRRLLDAYTQIPTVRESAE